MAIKVFWFWYHLSGLAGDFQYHICKSLVSPSALCAAVCSAHQSGSAAAGPWLAAFRECDSDWPAKVSSDALNNSGVEARWRYRSRVAAEVMLKIACQVRCEWIAYVQGMLRDLVGRVPTICWGESILRRLLRYDWGIETQVVKSVGCSALSSMF